MSLFLSRDDLQDLTGYKYSAGQKEWLQSRGWKFETNRQGEPKVLTSYAEAKLSGKRSNSIPSTPTPNFDAIS